QAASGAFYETIVPVTFCEIITFDPHVKGRHSRAGGNPESANLLKRLDSRFHGNDGKGYFQIFCEIITFYSQKMCRSSFPRNY
ncbi:MAG: hypothetical protein NTV04_00550, partial [Deltaproteobacteria bacterium]|nr:hypothetical protein [Deltaproteobacteria bacterium]